MIPRARTLGKTEGIMKAIVDAKTDRILGCTLLCAHSSWGSDYNGANGDAGSIPLHRRDGVLTHPTMTERLNLLFANF